MTISHPTNLAELLASMGAAGKRLNAIDAIEAGAGNLSASCNWNLDLTETFPDTTDIDLPLAVPNLAGYTVLVTGTGCRLREVADDPASNVGAVTIHQDGTTGTLHYRADGNFTRPTSEFNSHLAVHNDQVGRRGLDFHAVIHAQPPPPGATQPHPGLPIHHHAQPGHPPLGTRNHRSAPGRCEVPALHGARFPGTDGEQRRRPARPG